MQWELFIGRFHPLMVHLPIGIFLIAYAFEFLQKFGNEKWKASKNSLILLYTASLLSGLITAITGWLLSSSKDYGIKALNDHKNLAILFLLTLLVLVLYQAFSKHAKSSVKLFISTACLLMCMVTGHLGGNLTHGSDYLLKYAPKFLKPSLDEADIKFTGNTDSLQIYASFIQPSFEKNCYECHSEEYKEGGLILDSFSELFKEANYHTSIVPYIPELSEALSRIRLPHGHKKRMPPRQEGLSYAEVQILKYWIEIGADSLAIFNSASMSDELKYLMMKDYQLDFYEKSGTEKLDLDSLDSSTLSQLGSAGFKLEYLAENNLLLNVSFTNDSINIESIEMLNTVSDRIHELNLSKCNLTADKLNRLKDCRLLQSIDISGNPIDVMVVDFLSKCSNLKTIKLNRTELDDEAAKSILEAVSAERIYLFETNISEDEVKDLQAEYKDKEIISAFSFKEVEPAKSVFEQENPE